MQQTGSLRVLLEPGYFKEKLNFLIGENRETIIKDYLKLLIIIADVIYKSKFVASSYIKIRSHYWQYYIGGEIYPPSLTSLHQSMLGGAAHQSLEANRGKLTYSPAVGCNWLSLAGV